MRKLIITTATAIVVAIGMVGAAAPALADDPVPPPPGKPIQGQPVQPPTPRLDVDHKPQGVKAPKGSPSEAPKGLPNKLSAKAPLTPNPGYKYATGAQPLSVAEAADGVSVDMSVSKPFLADTQQGDSHSVLELAVQAPDPITSLRNVNEIGVNVDPTVNGDKDPHLFVYHWINGAETCYNGCGWFDAVGCSPCAGDALTGDIGTTKKFEWQHIGTAWWARYNNNYVGAYPDSEWASGFTKIRTVQAFGELYVANSNNNSDDGDESCSDMGSGALAGAGASTNIQNYTLTNSMATPNFQQSVTSVPGIWGYTQPSPTYIRVGGPGDDSIGEALGYKGSCGGPAEGTPAASSLQVWKEACPDGAAVTGCNSAWSKPWSGQTINACHPVTSPDDKWRRVWGNYLSSGKSFYVYATTTCGATRQLVTNASKLVTPWDIHGWARAA